MDKLNNAIYQFAIATGFYDDIDTSFPRVELTEKEKDELDKAFENSPY